MQVPRLMKITVNMGLGEAVSNGRRSSTWASSRSGDHGPEAGDHARPQEHRDVQAPHRVCPSA
jgi:hypothetical protein